jgi:rod shape determining protein RodA
LTSINLRIKEQIKRKIINTRFSLINILIDKNPQLFSYIISAAVVSPILFLVFIQPSLGNTIILGILWLLILFVSFSSKLQLEVIFTILIAVMTGGVLFGIVDLGSFYEKIGISLIIKGVDVLLLCISTLALLIISIKKIISPKSIIIGAVLGIIVFPIFSWTWENTLEDYQRERVETFIKGAETDRYGSGYQVTQSKIALGSGMLFGRGFLQGSQSSLRVLDFAYTDFIFASLGEQFGLTGTLFVLILYLILIIRIIQISISINDSFYSFVSMGVAIMILLNVFINTGMNMGILPVTGVPLPLVSYGGNSIIVNLIGLGIVQSLHARAHFLNKKSSAYSTDTISGINWSEIPLRT